MSSKEATSTGLTRCALKPAALLRLISVSAPNPLKATAGTQRITNVAITNSFVGSLTVSKSVVGSAGGASFTVAVNCDDGTAHDVVVGGLTHDVRPPGLHVVGSIAEVAQRRACDECRLWGEKRTSCARCEYFAF